MISVQVGASLGLIVLIACRSAMDDNILCTPDFLTPVEPIAQLGQVFPQYFAPAATVYHATPLEPASQRRIEPVGPLLQPTPPEAPNPLLKKFGGRFRSPPGCSQESCTSDSPHISCRSKAKKAMCYLVNAHVGDPRGIFTFCPVLFSQIPFSSQESAMQTDVENCSQVDRPLTYRW